ncbi:RNase H-like domain-containing protein, partial [Mycobacterium kansasii]
SNTAVSATLIREDSSVQRPIYYISQALRCAEQNYPLLEKMSLALVTASRRLCPYFQAHSIVVLTDQPLKKIMQQP